MTPFRTLIKGLSQRASGGDLDVLVRGVVSDTRKLEPGDVYVAVVDALHKGLDFVADAVARGAAALVLPAAPETDPGVPWLVVPHTGAALARLCAAVYGEPTGDLVGITGTSGKTTTATILHTILETAGRKAGLFGTAVGATYLGETRKTGLTTPEAPELFALLAEMRASGVDAVTMEVSSHGISLKRTYGLPWTVGVLTGVGNDHLDFHESHDAYADTKVNWLLDEVARSKRVKGVVVPEDDEFGMQVHSEFRGGPVLTFGFEEEADIFPLSLELSPTGTRGTIHTPDGGLMLDLRLPGRHNVRNAMAAIGAAQLLGIQAIDIVDGISRVQRVPGRLEPVPNDRGFTVLVDYAHKPDALLAVLTSVRELIAETARVIVVFGCGGDRDRQKRPEMARIAYAHADEVVITSDNPRSEDPQSIVEEILLGLPADVDGERVHVDVDRASAIARAMALAEPGDLVLIAGKGHETGQIIKGETRPFDDRLVAAEVLAR